MAQRSLDSTMSPNASRLVHLILTRFNCRFIDGGFSTGNQPGWLEHRFGLFERYCLPTLKAQTSQNFEWFLYFDTQTPPVFLDRAKALLAGYPHFHIRLVDVYSGAWMLADLADHLGTRCDWLLTTRLDNDDGLNARFVESLQKHAKPGSSEVLNFSNGVVLSDGRIYISRQPSNAFLSVSEPFDGFRTALHAPHKEMDQHFRLREIAEAPMWLQVIHDTNVSNKRRGQRIVRAALPPGFDSVPELYAATAPESKLKIAAENLTLSLLWRARDYASHTLRRLRSHRRLLRGSSR